MTSDFIPTTDTEFDVWFKNLAELVKQRTAGTPPPWDHIPPAAVAALAGAYAAWHEAYEVTLKPHTPVDTEAKNRLRAEGETAVRKFINEYLRYSSKVSPEDHAALGLHGRRPPSPVPVPTTCPMLLIDTGTRRRIIVYYRDEGSMHRGKPKKVHGIEVRWEILDHYPASGKELDNSSFDTKQPLVLEFDENMRGKHIYLCGRWEIEREGEKGPFGAIVEAIIP